MSYTVWIMVEDDNAQGGEGRTYWSVDTHRTKEEAIESARKIATLVGETTGLWPERLED